MSETKRKKTASQPSAEPRRAFLAKSAGVGAFALALEGLLHGSSTAQGAADVRIAPGGPVRPGEMKITEAQAAKLNAVHNVIQMAMESGDIQGALNTAGRNLAAEDKAALATLTREDLAALKRIRQKIKALGPDLAGMNGVFGC
jgi:hypothetical protein